MGTNCAQLIADLFLNFYERDFISQPVQCDNKTFSRPNKTVYP